MSDSTVPLHNQGSLELEVILADGTRFNLGSADSPDHARQTRKLIRHRLKTEPAFREAFGHLYTRRGKRR